MSRIEELKNKGESITMEELEELYRIIAELTH